jgi:riboflavin kinase/FMN adenylyltransferase
MHIADDFKKLPHDNKYKSVALGNFDGVHAGHRELILAMHEAAKKNNGYSIVLSFVPHPLQILTGKSPNMLTAQSEKELLVAALEVDYFVRYPFTFEIADLSPETFIKEILIDGLGANHVFVGFNFSFGKKALGTPEVLQEICSSYGCEVTIMPAVRSKHGIVSSSLIRKELYEGDVLTANYLLGYSYYMKGIVVGGKRLGRQLGYPTANVAFRKEAQLPAYGVYAAILETENGDFLQAIVNVGIRPTVDDDLKPSLEAYCFDFDGNLYDKWVTVHFVERVRFEKKFASKDDLVEQIQKDCLVARDIMSRKDLPKLFSQITCANQIDVI